MKGFAYCTKIFVQNKHPLFAYIIIFLKIIINQQNDDFDKHSKGEEAQGRILSLITIESKGRSTSVIDDIFFWPNVILHHHRCHYYHGRLCPHCCYDLCI